MFDGVLGSLMLSVWGEEDERSKVGIAARVQDRYHSTKCARSSKLIHDSSSC
jgi:hypothetical protein